MKRKCDVSLLLILAMFLIGTCIAFVGNIHVSSIMSHYSYNVLVILIVMELFTNLIAETGIMQLLAVKIAERSKGQKRHCLILFGIMMFFISAFLNNITAVMMILPIVIVLLKSLDVDKRYVSAFFAVILALSNTGGAASPVGDFPAIVIMTSGITDFINYLIRAMPLFLVTSVALIALWGTVAKFDDGEKSIRQLAVINLKSQYKNICVRYDVLKKLAIVFIGMFLAWSFIPQDVLPPEVIAILGYACAMILCSTKGIRILQRMDLKPVLTIASFLFFAEVISQTGLLCKLAEYLQANVSDPKMLVISIMLITAIASGIFSAGPAAAAMMPIIVNICEGPLKSQSNWVAVAYAAAICAGSSLFMWSATAGFILSGKVNEARIQGSENEKKTIQWGSKEYWKYGFVNFFVQLLIAIAAMVLLL
jgi:Na+/H+ antiporter NhaD/arsenite permease-like protein